MYSTLIIKVKFVFQKWIKYTIHKVQLEFEMLSPKLIDKKQRKKRSRHGGLSVVRRALIQLHDCKACSSLLQEIQECIQEESDLGEYSKHHGEKDVAQIARQHAFHASEQ